MRDRSNRPPRPPRRHDDPHKGSGDSPRGLSRGARIVLEDDDLLVADKPCGMLSAYVGGPRGEGYEGDDLFSLVKKHVRGKTRTRGRQPVFVVHRLDREVSGLMIFAKSERALHWLKEDLRSRRLTRLYYAVVEGELPTSGPGSSGTVQSFLRENAKGIVESSSKPLGAGTDPGDSKLAVTHWRCVNAGRGKSLLQIRLETGRKNQIRVHMLEMGHPIVGDRRYGSSEDPVDRVCLHAGELGFVHAFNGRAVKLKSPIPREFFKLVGAGRDEAAAIEKGAPEESGPASQPASAPVSKDAGWDHVAGWYDRMIEEGRSDHFEKVIIPGTLRMLGAKPGEKCLDVACGQGAFARTLSKLRIETTGVDAAPGLIEAARRASGSHKPAPHFVVGDARTLGDLDLPGAPFDCATCLMALMNIEPLSPLFAGLAKQMRPGAHLVAVILHPAFRAPGQTSWGWDGGETRAERSNPARNKRFDPRGPGKRGGPPPASGEKQYRRVDGYLSPGYREIVMNPGAVASGAERILTLTHHRPIQTYVRTLREAGFLIDALEEWPSARESEPGPRAAEENRARREIPMFLALRAVFQPQVNG